MMAGKFGIYIHWPYCEAKCPYCDFNSHVSKSIDFSDWSRAYLSEIKRVSYECSGRTVSSVYFGGGTPSTMSVGLVDEILDAIRLNFSLSNDCEITLEANPGSVEVEKFRGFRHAGVNRVSVGVQALDDESLIRLGRIHNTKEALKAIEVAGSVFDRVSFDLIYARQDQSLDGWRSELSRALDLAKGHLSLYQLTIEPGTMFGRRFDSGKLSGLPNEDLSADMYELTQSLCEDAGCPAYEVSNHSLPGHESVHNMIYWDGGEYAGIGPGAHGRLNLDQGRTATATHLMPGEWLKQVAETGSGELERDVLSDNEFLTERILMGLRTTSGLDTTLSPELLGIAKSERTKSLIEDGFLVFEKGRLTATRTGRPVLNALIRELAVQI